MIFFVAIAFLVGIEVGQQNPPTPEQEAPPISASLN